MREMNGNLAHKWIFPEEINSSGSKIEGMSKDRKGIPMRNSGSKKEHQNRVEHVENDVKISLEGISVFYGSNRVIKDVSLEIGGRMVTALIGSSACGKSTLLRTINRMNDLVPEARVEGKVIFEGKNVYDKDVDPVCLRSRIGMVFQRSNPFPKSIYDNVAYGPRIHGMVKKGSETDEIVETALRQASLWEEVKDKLDSCATHLSGGQKQRLCIARAIAIQPEVLLMDEPCSALDPISTAKIEELIGELREHYAVVIVTHSMQQAARVSQKTAFFNFGELIEYSDTDLLFTNPEKKETEDYITGRFG